MLKLSRLFLSLLSLSGNAKIIFISFTILSVFVALSEIVLISLVADIFSSINNSDKSLSINKLIPFNISAGYLVLLVALSVFILRIYLISKTAKITFTTGANLIAYIFNKLIYQNLNYFGKDDKSRHIAFLVSKIEVVVHTLVLPFLNLVSAGVISIIFLIYISYISPLLSLISFVVAAVSYGIPIIISKNILSKVAKTLSIDVASQVHNIKTSFEGLRDLKIWNIEKHFIDNVNEKSLNIADARKTTFIWSLVPRSVIEVVIFVSIGIFLLASSQNDISSEFSIVFVTFFLALLKVLPSFQQTYYSWQNLRAGHDVSFELAEYFDVSIPNYNSLKVDSSFDSLELRNISFSYDEHTKILENFNFMISKSDKIAIFGESGCGKSTLLDLIAGINKQDNGEILLNSKLLNTSDLNPFIAYISQDPFLFDMSIKDNITLQFATKKEVNQEKLNNALIRSGVKKYMKENNISVDYIIGESGSMLSGGQAQRIAIARALYSNKEILLLDEAASALDSQTRDYIIHELLALDVSVLIITHDENIYKKFPKRMNFKTKKYEN